LIGLKFPSLSSCIASSGASTVVVAVLLLGIGAESLAQDRGRGRGRDGYRGMGRSAVPDLGQARPLYRLSDLGVLIESLEIDESHRPVIEMILTDYQDRYRDAAASYASTIGSLKPESSGSEQIASDQEALRKELKEIREDITVRYRNGEWDGDHAKMREALSEATRDLQQQILELEKAKSDSLDWSGYFNQYSIAFEEWAALRDELNGEFESSLQAFLDPQQETNWQMAMADNWIRRELSEGELGGESIDLEKLVRAHVLDEEAAERAQDEIDQWKADIGSLLASRSVAFDDILRGYLSSGVSGSADGWSDATRREVMQRGFVRDANINALFAVSEALGDEQGLRFQEVVLKQVFPTVFSRGRVLRGIDEATGSRPSLEEDQLESLAALRADASAWMLAYALRSREAFQNQDQDRLITRRQSGAEQVFGADDFDREADWSGSGQASMDELMSWETVMLESLRSIIGEARFSRLSIARKAPDRDGDQRGRRGRGGR